MERFIALMLVGGVFVVLAMLLWNWLMPVIFGLPKIGILQTLGLLALSNVLVKSSSVLVKSSS